MTTATVLPVATATPDVASKVFTSPSASHPGVHHTLGIVESTSGTLIVRCTCPAGMFPRRKPVPCRHARGVVELLDGLGAVEPAAGGSYRLTCAVSTVWDDLARSGNAEPESSWTIGYRAGWADAVAHLAYLVETLPTIDVAAVLAEGSSPWPVAA